MINQIDENKTTGGVLIDNIKNTFKNDKKGEKIILPKYTNEDISMAKDIYKIKALWPDGIYEYVKDQIPLIKKMTDMENLEDIYKETDEDMKEYKKLRKGIYRDVYDENSDSLTLEYNDKPISKKKK